MEGVAEVDHVIREGQQQGGDGPVDVIIALRCRGQALMGDHHITVEASVGVPRRRLGVTGFDSMID